MSIVTFYNSSIEQTGKTMSMVAIATYMAIAHNYRILLVSTTNKEDILKIIAMDREETIKTFESYQNKSENKTMY